MNVRASILVIDDEPGFRDLLSFDLARNGYEVVAAESGTAALERVRNRRFDLAVTDLKMPGMDGIQTLTALKELDPDIEVIVATGYGAIETAITCMKRGAYDYIRKPYDLDELKMLLERALERRQLQSAVALYEASRSLLHRLGLDELIEDVLAMAERVLGGSASVLVLDAGVGGPALVRAHGLEVKAAEEVVQLTQKQPDAPAEAWRDAWSAVEGTPDGALHLFPLVVRDRGLGTLVIVRPFTVAPLSSVERRQGAIFAAQAALALDNARAWSTLESLAVTDDLTGLFSRKYLLETAERHITRDPETLPRMSFLMVDVDHFKAVNDTYGHGVGDKTLKRVAELTHRATRGTDIVARLGGEEFGVLLVGADEEQATRVAERIRAAVQSGTSDPAVTVSIGVAGLTEGLETPIATIEDLMERADQALYRAKGTGRNRWIAASTMVRRLAEAG